MTKFIVFEGGEFVGKTTQIQLFKAKLESLGKRVLVVKNPGTTEYGAHIRKEVLTPSGAYSTYTQFTKVMMMLTALRSVADEIASVQADYDYVLADRWFYTTLVYHCRNDPSLRARAEDIIKMVFPEVDPSSVNFRNPFVFYLSVNTKVRTARKLARVEEENHLNDKLEDSVHQEIDDAFREVLYQTKADYVSITQILLLSTPEDIAALIWRIFELSSYSP